MKADLEDWVDEWYSIEKYKATYSYVIYPIRDPKFWPKMDNIPLLSPPLIKRKGAQLSKVREETMMRVERRGSEEEMPQSVVHIVRALDTI